ncbi:hypothetical protein [Polaribacter dokdonensis]|uniref:Uncharacterized protein n=1 Tax=Polaribacter dokdonensis DSW-5 TaxID=1300348 RepID=A0A0M9CFB6_9FLAO|nr:hypothetical protein [Polaribacter dokdonensis]KOY51313.1 hypothetical protein I602_873 [Polaribacter dokdonensis DSW-5]SEE14135.1 hypothetical protein SAMN05444353_0906 [Polaribacter dokdonensis DSW-5]
MKKYKAYLPLLFPVLIILIGLIIYKILDYEPNFYTIIINIGLAYILSPRVKTIQKQNGTQEQLTWVFLKKIIE